MQCDFTATLYDNEKNRKKLEIMHPLEVLLDDSDVAIPDEWYYFVSDLPLGTTIRFRVEVVKPKLSDMGGFSIPFGYPIRW